MLWWEPKLGFWAIRLGKGVLRLKAPWDEPLFSEREGYRPPLLKYKGWRFFAEWG